jgi:hypothetical protein
VRIWKGQKQRRRKCSCGAFCNRPTSPEIVAAHRRCEPIACQQTPAIAAESAKNGQWRSLPLQIPARQSASVSGGARAGVCAFQPSEGRIGVSPRAYASAIWQTAPLWYQSLRERKLILFLRSSALFGIRDQRSEAGIAMESIQIGVFFHLQRLDGAQADINGLLQKRERLFGSATF